MSAEHEVDALTKQVRETGAKIEAALRGPRYSMIHIGENLFRLDGATGEIEVFPLEDFFEEAEEEEEDEEQTEEEQRPKIPPPVKADSGVLRASHGLLRRIRSAWPGSKSLSAGGSER